MNRPPHRVAPATSTVHLEFQAGEDIDVEVLVTDIHDAPLPLTAAVAQIKGLDGTVHHTWSTEDGTATLGDDDGVVVLHSTREDTTRWYAEFEEAEWGLTSTDVFGKRKVPAGGQLTVRPPRTEPDA